MNKLIFLFAFYIGPPAVMLVPWVIFIAGINCRPANSTDRCVMLIALLSIAIYLTLWIVTWHIQKSVRIFVMNKNTCLNSHQFSLTPEMIKVIAEVLRRDYNAGNPRVSQGNTDHGYCVDNQSALFLFEGWAQAFCFEQD
jgi:low affinity Fe/Cu permease